MLFGILIPFSKLVEEIYSCVRNTLGFIHAMVRIEGGAVSIGKFGQLPVLFGNILMMRDFSNAFINVDNDCTIENG